MQQDQFQLFRIANFSKVRNNLRQLGRFLKHNTFQIVEGFRNLPDSDPTTISDGTQDPVRKPPLKNKRLD